MLDSCSFASLENVENPFEPQKHSDLLNCHRISIFGLFNLGQ